MFASVPVRVRYLFAGIWLLQDASLASMLRLHVPRRFGYLRLFLLQKETIGMMRWPGLSRHRKASHEQRALVQPTSGESIPARFETKIGFIGSRLHSPQPRI